MVKKSIRFGYTNYRGEFSTRHVHPMSFWFGDTKYHPKPQWFMSALDHDKKLVRDFALADCDFSLSEVGSEGRGSVQPTASEPTTPPPPKPAR